MAALKDWLEVIVKYWPQLVVLIGSIIIILQKIVELVLKRKEIKFSRIQENKVLEIKSFYKSYQGLFIVLRRFAYQTEFGDLNEEGIQKLKQEITQKLDEFDYSSMVVRLFIDSDDLATIDEIREEFEKIRVGVSMWHNFKNRKTSNYIEKYDNALTEIVNEIIPKRLPSLIKKIETNLRKSFDLK